MIRTQAALLREYQDYWGPVGVAATTLKLRQAMCRAFEWEDIILDFLEFCDLLVIQITHPVNSLGSTLKNLREVQVSDSNFRIHKIDFVRQEPENLLAIFDVC